jgi:hypothetical protein
VGCRSNGQTVFLTGLMRQACSNTKPETYCLDHHYY